MPMTETDSGSPTVRVSVVIVTYNHERYLAETLDSVLQQRPTFADFEIVVTDDGSTDSTGTILEDYADRWPGVVRPLVNSSGQRGIPENVNRGLAAARGEFVAVLDGDDTWLPGRLAAQVAALDQYPAATLCFGPAVVFDDATGDVLYETNTGQRAVSHAADLLEHGCFVLTCTTLIRRSAIPDRLFSLEVRRACDWLFFIEIARSGPVVMLPQPLARYRRHETQLSASTGAMVLDGLQTMDIVERDYPELRSSVASGRANVWLWEAHRRAKAVDARRMLAAYAKSLAARPAHRATWESLLGIVRVRLAVGVRLARISRIVRFAWLRRVLGRWSRSGASPPGYARAPDERACRR